jgi:hypothetical protein
MRTLALVLAASAVSFAAASPSMAGTSTTPATLTATTSQARPAVRLVHYALLERVPPLPATGAALRGASATMIVPVDAEGVPSDRIPDGWVAIGALTVESYGPPAASTATIATASQSATSESAPNVPRVLAVSPSGANPASGRSLVVDVALPTAAPARLEMLDVMGRVVAERDLGALGTGRHAVDLSAGLRAFAPGVYLVRVTQGGDARVARVTVID